MLDEQLIATLEQTLIQTRNAQNLLAAKLIQAEAEVEMLRIELNALENSASQTVKAIDSLLIATRGHRVSIRLEDDPHPGSNRTADVPIGDVSSVRRDNTVPFVSPSRTVPSITSRLQPISNRFNDRTITQSCRILLREAGRPLHVNELYNLLVSGGMRFKGNNPTISVAVSLSRNRDFRKVDPGTFELVARDSRQIAS